MLLDPILPRFCVSFSLSSHGDPPTYYWGLPLPDFSKRSFAEVISSQRQVDSPQAQSRVGSHRGFPVRFFWIDHVGALSKPFLWTLVGKFAQGYNETNPKLGRPPVEKLQKYFELLDFKGVFSIGLLDNRHILMHLSFEEDFLLMYSWSLWYVGGLAMRIFKWTS